MTKVTKSLAVPFVVGAVLLWALTASAGPVAPVPQGPPFWCYGLNDLDQCVLFLGTEQSCMNVSPCNNFSAAGGGTPVETEQWFCMGEDEFGRCQLYVATRREQCETLTPCRAILGQLPRLPKVRACEE